MLEQRHGQNAAGPEESPVDSGGELGDIFIAWVVWELCPGMWIGRPHAEAGWGSLWEDAQSQGAAEGRCGWNTAACGERRGIKCLPAP